MIRWLPRIAMLLLLFAAWPALAQTRAWLDREQVTYGETATLNIETDLSVQQVDYVPLQRQFDIAGQTVRRSFDRVNGQSRTRSLFAVGIRPRGPGVLTVPALRVGKATTSPLRLTVLPPSVQPANGDADVFIDTTIDAAQPYVQQAVGMVVRLHYAVPLLSGQLDQEAPPNASLQRVGEDITYQREIAGRRFNVVERRFLLVPERSGPLAVPGARFNGQGAGGFFDQIFDDGRKPLSAAAPLKRLQVQPIPADAPQPWLPLRDLKLRYVQSPRRARTGEATIVELEAIADGANASQLPALILPDSDAAQVFADPPQFDERFIEGRPVTTLRRRIAIVPLKPGALSLPGPRIDWWDAMQGVPRTSMLPPLQLDVAAGAKGPLAQGTTPGLPGNTAGGAASPDLAAILRQQAPWWLLGMALVAGFGWWRMRPRDASAAIAADSSVVITPAPAPRPQATSLAKALKAGEFAGIAQALCADAGLRVDDLDAVRMQLGDPAQAAAVQAMQAARWGDGDAAAALAAMRHAFARGVRWQAPGAPAKPLLPPLYPDP